jgi:peptidoglycan/xylan/chitin deacetylase (PgdA/CDA1 family)
VISKSFAVLVIAACALVVMTSAPLIPPGDELTASRTANALEPQGGRVYSLLPVGEKPLEAQGLVYLVPRARTPDKLPKKVSLAVVRDAGLLMGYSLPPRCLAFVPGGRTVFLPRSPALTGPCQPWVIDHGNRDKPRVALTFDSADVPDSNSRAIIDELTRLRAPATFFVCEGWWHFRPDLVRMLVDRGFEVGNHSTTHPDFTKIPNEAIVSELAATANAFHDVTGAGMAAYFRPPFGAYDARVEQVAAQCGYRLVTWNVDTLDWSPTTIAEQIRDRATASARNGDIVLMHTHARYTLSMLPQIVNNLRAKGFELTTVSGILQP